MKNGKSCSLLWHLCLPTHNAVLRFVELPRSLLVCMYPSIPPTLHLSLIAQQRRRMLYFRLQTLLQCYPHSLHPLDCYSGKYVASCRFLLLNLETKRGVFQMLHTDRDRNMPVNTASTQPLTQD